MEFRISGHSFLSNRLGFQAYDSCLLWFLMYVRYVCTAQKIASGIILSQQ